jgi:hypothetical protein
MAVLDDLTGDENPSQNGIPALPGFPRDPLEI